MLENFSINAQKAMRIARIEADRLRLPKIDLDQIFSGLLRVNHGTATSILEDLGCKPEEILVEIEKRNSDSPKEYQNLYPLTDVANSVISRAVDEAEAVGHNYVGTEHLLLGLFAEQKNIAQCLLSLSIEDVRTEIMEYVGAEFGTRGNKKDTESHLILELGISESQSHKLLDLAIAQGCSIEEVLSGLIDSA